MSEELKEVYLYTDGACSGNPGPGGWASILVHGNTEKELFGGEAQTTNNRMELLAVINGLSALKYKCKVTIYSDSKYIVDAVNLGWAKKWQQNNWMRNKKEKALNTDLWEKLLKILEKHETTLIWVKGHAGHAYNERCDKLAVEQCKQYQSI